MAWTWVAGVHAFVDDVGPYLPGDTRPRCPYHTLITGDVNEIDYVVVPTGTDPTTFYWAQGRYDSYSYRYAVGASTAWSFDAGSGNDTVSAASYRLFVVAYTDASDPSTPPAFSAASVTPTSYATIGTAVVPTPPANDDFADAIDLPSTRSGSFDLPADMDWASLEPEEIADNQYPYGGTTVWYRFEPPADGDYLFTTPGVGGDPSEPSSWVYAYRESDHPGVHPATEFNTWQQNDGGDRNEMHITGAVAGETIWLQVDTASSYAAHITWAGPAPTNDDFANRISIDMSAGPVEIAYDLGGSTLESGEQQTSGMTGSVWYEITVTADDANRMLFTALDADGNYDPTVEVVRFRGTATLAGMLFRDRQDATHRFSLNMGVFTYFVKLQSSTATQSGKLRIQPYAWTGYMPRPTVLRTLGGQHSTHMQFGYIIGEGPVDGYPSLDAAWTDSLGGPLVSGNKVQYPNGNLNGSTSSPSWFGKGVGKVSGNYYTDYVEATYAVDFNDWLDPGQWPDDPTDFQPSLIDLVDYAPDPVSGDSIQYEAGDAEIGSGMGRLFAGAVAHSSQSSDALPGHSVDVYVRRYTPTLDPTTTVPDWQTPDITGLQKAFTISDTPGLYGSVTDELDIEWDIVADLDGGTKVSYLLLPDPSTPEDPGGDEDAGYILWVNNARVFPSAPILYPRYRTYAPIPMPTAVTGWLVGSVAW